MKRALLASACALSLLASCSTGYTHEYNHWKSAFHPPVFGTIWNRTSYHFLGWRPEERGYWSQFGSDMGDIGLTFQRHMFLDNPTNPFLRASASGEIDMPDYDIPEWQSTIDD